MSEYVGKYQTPADLPGFPYDDESALAPSPTPTLEEVSLADPKEAKIYNGDCSTLSKANPKEAMGALKPNMSLFPPVAEIYIAKVMEGGAEEYGPYNWRVSPISHTVYIAATRRHLAAMLDGEWFDKKSGHPHAAHIAASMGIIMDADSVGTLINDLPPLGKASELLTDLTKPSKV